MDSYGLISGSIKSNKKICLGFAFGSNEFSENFDQFGVGLGSVEFNLGHPSVSNFSLYWLPCNKKTLGKTPGTRHFFPSTRHLKMGRFNKV